MLRKRKTRVANIAALRNSRVPVSYVYIGRARKSGHIVLEDGYFGNPYRIDPEVSREQVIDLFRSYFYNRIKKDPEFRKRVEGLRGKTLGCFCKPLACHGDVYVEYLEERTRSTSQT